MLQSRSDYSPIPSEPQEPTSNGLPALSSQKRTMVMAGWVAVAMVLLIFVVTNTANDAAADVSVMQSTIFEPTAEPTSFWEKYIPTEEHLPEPSTVPTAGWMGNDHRRKDPFPTPVYPPSSPVQPWYSSVYGSKYPGTPTLAPVAMPSDPAGKNKLDPAPLVQEEAESEPWWARFVPPSMRPKIPVLNPTQPPTTDADSQPSLEPTAGPGKDGEDEDKDHDKKKHHHHKKHHKHDDDDDSGSSEDKEEDEKEPSSEGDNNETGPAAGEVPPAEPVESNSFVVIASEPKNGDPWWMQFVPSQFRSKVRKDLTMQPTTSPVAAPVPVPVNPPPAIVEPPAVPAEPVPLTLTPTVATTPAPGKEDKDHKKDDKKEDRKHDEDDKKSDKKEKDKKEEKKHHKHDDDDDSAGSDDDSASSEKEPRHKDEKEKEDKKGKDEIVVKHKHEDGDSSEEGHKAEKKDKKGKEEIAVEHKHEDGDSSEEDKKGKEKVVVEHKHEGK